MSSWFIAPMEKPWFYERLFFKEIIGMVKDEKKYGTKDRMSIKISFMHYMKWTRVMLPLFFEEFEVVYIFLLLFSFYYHCQFTKGQLEPGL